MTGSILALGWYTLRSKPQKEHTLYQYVSAKDGPFAGYRGMLEARLSGYERMRVLLSMIQGSRQILVELSVGSLTKE